MDSSLTSDLPVTPTIDPESCAWIYDSPAGIPDDPESTESYDPHDDSGISSYSHYHSSSAYTEESINKLMPEGVKYDGSDVVYAHNASLYIFDFFMFFDIIFLY